MKKKYAVKLGGLQFKTILLVLLTLIATVGVVALASGAQNRMLVQLVGETRTGQQQAISQVSRDTMNRVLANSLIGNTALQADVADNDFSEVVNDVFMLQTMVQGVFDNREILRPGAFRLPDASMDGSPAAMVLCEEGVNYRRSAYLPLAATLSDPMIAMLQNSEKIDGCFIGFVDGTDLCVDEKAASKLDESGTPIPFPVRERPWYTGAVEAGGLHFTGIMEDAFSGNLLVTCSTPVYSRGELVGVVGIDIVLDSMRSFMRSATEGSIALVVNEEDQVILSSEQSGLFSALQANSGRSLRDLGNNELMRFVGQAHSAATEQAEFTLNGRTYYAAGAPMPTVGWAVVSIVDKESTEQPEKLLLAEYERINDEASAKFRAGSAQAWTFIRVCVGLVTAFAVILALFAANKIVRPLEDMTDSIVKSGQTGQFFEMKPSYRTRDEIEVLAEAFEGLSMRTKQYIEDLTQITREKERVNTELNLASQIQSSTLPHVFPAFPERSEFDIFASMDPAREVGGDFYDFFLIDDDHLCLLIADVSGKGVPASLFMMISKVILHNYAILGKSPAEVLAMTNAALCAENAVEMFVTAWMGILEISTGKIIAANAGHEYPTLMHDGVFTLLKDRHSFILGGMENVRYKEYELRLSPGDRLFLYTDGVPEAANAQDQLFGTERMLAALNTAPEATPEQILRTVRAAVDEFVQDAEQFDDLTMLCLEYRGQ